MNRQRFFQILDESPFEKVSSFFNEFNEEFVVYRLHVPEMSSMFYYVTGSEVDWELGWYYVDGSLVRELQLGTDEAKNVEAIIKKNMEERHENDRPTPRVSRRSK